MKSLVACLMGLIILNSAGEAQQSIVLGRVLSNSVFVQGDGKKQKIETHEPANKESFGYLNVFGFLFPLHRDPDPSIFGPRYGAQFIYMHSVVGGGSGKGLHLGFNASVFRDDIEVLGDDWIDGINFDFIEFGVLGGKVSEIDIATELVTREYLGLNYGVVA